MARKPYNYTINLKPWPDRGAEGGEVCIDPVALYGYWEHANGAEGGGLWFDRAADGHLVLLDFDGAYILRLATVRALIEAGIEVSAEFVTEWSAEISRLCTTGALLDGCLDAPEFVPAGFWSFERREVDRAMEGYQDLYRPLGDHWEGRGMAYLHGAMDPLDIERVTP